MVEEEEEEGVGLTPQGTRTKHEEEKEARVNEEEEKEARVGRRDQAGGQSRRVDLNWRLWEADAEGVSQPRREKEKARVNEEEVGGGAQQAQARDVFLDARQTVHQH